MWVLSAFDIVPRLTCLQNWYQNRRAKARHQGRPEQSFNVVSAEQSSHWSLSDLSYPNFLEASTYGFPGPLAQQSSSGDLLSNSAPNDLGGIKAQQGFGIDSIQSVLDSAPNFVSHETTGNNFGFPSEPGPIYLRGSTAAMSMPALQDWDIHQWATDSRPATSAQDENPTATQVSLDTCSQSMYQNCADGYLVGNPSYQTFATTSSSDGEQHDFMTPPPKTSPLPFMTQDTLDRRESVTSDLAHNFDTIRLQRQQSNRGLYDDMFHQQGGQHLQMVATDLPAVARFPDGSIGTSPTPHFGSGNGSQDSPRLDIASRRKRPRPAALRPDAHRSQSYAGPLTTSPNLKMPLLNVGPSQSVRRIKSTPFSMNVINARVQKSGLMSAQMSPRNFQACFEASAQPESQTSTGQNTSTTELCGAVFTPPTPPSPTNAEKPDYHAEAWSNPFDQTQDSSTPTYIGNGANVTSPPITPFNSGNLSQIFSNRFIPTAQNVFQQPPQSAPPQHTAFFGDSPPEVAGRHNPPSWQVPPSMLLETYPIAGQPPVPHPAFVPQYGYYDSPTAYPAESHHFAPSPPTNGFSQPTLYGNSSPVCKPLEINVQLGPKPQGSPQPRKEYVFHHATPKDFTPSDN